MEVSITVGSNEYIFDPMRAVHGWTEGHWYLLEKLVEDTSQAMIIAVDDHLLRLFVEILGDYYIQQRNERCILSL